MPMQITDDEITRRMGFHRGTFPADREVSDIVDHLRDYVGELDEYGSVATAPLHAEARHRFIKLAKWINRNTEPGREQSLALTALEEALMRANQAIAMGAPLVDEG